MNFPNRETLTNPRIFGRVLNRKYYDWRNGVEYNHKGIDIISEKWDTLAILDACRYDLFANQDTLEGDLQERISRGSATNEWLHANFDGRELHDLVYVTSNPMYLNNSEKFDLDLHAIIDVDDIDPEKVTKEALSAHKKYPHKRILVHYMQPHYPFIADNTPMKADKKKGKQNIWNQLMEGEADVNPDNVRESYHRNLWPVLKPVQMLINKIEGRVVVSADHGNHLGERAYPISTIEWGHPQGVYTRKLVRIPWLVCQDGNRRTISENPVESVDLNKGASDRLEYLGYV